MIKFVFCVCCHVNLVQTFFHSFPGRLARLRLSSCPWPASSDSSSHRPPPPTRMPPRSPSTSACVRWTPAGGRGHSPRRRRLSCDTNKSFPFSFYIFCTTIVERICQTGRIEILFSVDLRKGIAAACFTQHRFFCRPDQILLLFLHVVSYGLDMRREERKTPFVLCAALLQLFTTTVRPKFMA